MSFIGRYILSVGAAGLLCGILRILLGDRGTVSTVGKTILGLAMTVVVLSPVMSINLSGITNPLEAYAEDAKTAISQGQKIYRNDLNERIIKLTEAYILEEARNLGLDIQVQVELSDEDIPAPCRIIIQGNASAYARASLQRFIQDQLSVGREDQIWT